MASTSQELNRQIRNGESEPVDTSSGVWGSRTLRLLEKAIREEWDMPDNYRKAIPLEIVEFFRKIKTEEGKEIYRYNARARLAAIRAMVSMHGQNRDRLEGILNQIRDEQRSIVNVNVGVQVGAIPTQEIVVDTREEVQEFSEIKKRLERIEAEKNGDNEQQN